MNILTRHELETLNNLPPALRPAFLRMAEAKDAWLRMPDDEFAYDRYSELSDDYRESDRQYRAGLARRSFALADLFAGVES